MARSRDIEFARMAMIFDFVKRDQVYEAIRELALLQELEINKNIDHIMYERRFMTVEQIQAVLWALFCAGRLNRFPARIVYEFTEEDDQQFVEKAMLPFQDVLDAVRRESVEKKNVTEALSSVFPQEPLIYCLDLQKKLKQKNIQRSVLSILNAKGYLKKTHRHLIPGIEEKKVVICSSKDAHNVSFQRRCEANLLAALANKQSKVPAEKIRSSFELWEEILDTHEVEIRFSELLFYLNYSEKRDISKYGIVLKEICGIDQTLRFDMLSLTVDETRTVQKWGIKEKYQETYQKSCELAKTLKESGLDLIEPGNILLHQKTFKRKDLISKTLAETGSNTKSKRAKKYEKILKNIAPIETSDLQDSQKTWSKKERRQLVKSVLPFSISELEKEIEKWYQQERKAARRNSNQQFDRLVHEWSQTQTIPFGEIDFSPTEDVPLRGTKPLPNLRLKTVTQKKGTDIRLADSVEQTGYMPLDDTTKEGRAVISAPVPGELEGLQQTAYFSLDASRAEVRLLRSRIAEKVGELRSTKILYWVILLLAVGTTTAATKLSLVVGGTESYLKIGFSMLSFFLPFLFLGKYLGKILDDGKVHRLFYWGFLSFFLCLLPLAVVSNFYLHLLLRIIQGTGGAAIFIALVFCVSRWFGAVERGRVLGLIMSIYTAGFSVGLLLGNVFPNNPEKMSTTICFTCAILGLLTLPFAARLRIKQAFTEDMEDEAEVKVQVSKKTLTIASIYGLVVMGLLGIFFPAVLHYEDWQSAPKDLMFWLLVGTVLGSYTLGRLGDKLGPIPILRFVCVLGIFCFALVPFRLTTNSALPLFFFIGAIIGSLIPLGFSWLLETIDDIRYFGMASGEFSFYQGIGFIVGCIVCGGILYKSNYSLFFLVLTLTFLGYFYFMLITPASVFARYRRRKLGGMLSLLEPTE